MEHVDPGSLVHVRVGQVWRGKTRRHRSFVVVTGISKQWTYFDYLSGPGHARKKRDKLLIPIFVVGYEFCYWS